MECEYRCDIRTFFVLLLLLLLSFLQEIQEIQEFHNLTGVKKDTQDWARAEGLCVCLSYGNIPCPIKSKITPPTEWLVGWDNV